MTNENIMTAMGCRLVFTFVTYSLIILLYSYTSLLQRDLLGKGSMRHLTMQKRDGDGRETRRKACESDWCESDSLRKVPTVGHLGDTSHCR